MEPPISTSDAGIGGIMHCRFTKHIAVKDTSSTTNPLLNFYTVAMLGCTENSQKY